MILNGFSHAEYLFAAYFVAGFIMFYLFIRAFRKAEKAQKAIKVYRAQSADKFQSRNGKN